MSEAIEADQAPGAPHPREAFGFVGHDAEEGALADALRGERVHHAWLMTGPKGLGKATLAYRFARVLLGARRIGPRPLDVDPSDPIARRISALSHGDLFVLRRTVGDRGRLRREIAAEDARALPGFFALAPAEGGWRVAIVDCVDDLNRHAANALLKILEEPPPRCVLMLICHSPGAALATIRSRCRRIALRPLSDEDCARGVEAALGVAPEANVLALAHGRPGRAVALQATRAPAMLNAVEAAVARLPKEGSGPLATIAFGREGDAQSRLDLFLDLTLDALADGVSAAVRGAAPRHFSTLIDPANAQRWAKAWSDLSALRDQADGLGMDPAHAFVRASAILAQAAGGRA